MVNGSALGIFVARNVSRRVVTGNAGMVIETTLANAQITWRTAGTFTKLYVRVITNTIDTGNTTVTLRFNNVAKTNTVTIGPGATGEFETAAQADVVAVGDEVHYEIITGTSSTVGHGITFSIFAILFEPTATTDTAVRHVATNFSDLSDGSTTYHTLSDAVSGASVTEASSEVRLAAAATMKNMFTYVSANGPGATINLRKNGVNAGPNIVYLTGTTGILEDIDSTAVYAAADDANYSVVSNIGTSFTLEIISIEEVSTAKKFHSTYARLSAGMGSQAFNTVKYVPIGGGGQQAGPEADVKADMNIAATVANLTCYLLTDTIT